MARNNKEQPVDDKIEIEDTSVEELAESGETLAAETPPSGETEPVEEPAEGDEDGRDGGEPPVSGDRAAAARLAEDFDLLQREVPSIRGVEDIPDGALTMAADEGLPLLDAYLRFRNREERRAAEERERRAQAAVRSSGPLAGETVRPHPEQEAFARAFRASLW